MFSGSFGFQSHTCGHKGVTPHQVLVAWVSPCWLQLLLMASGRSGVAGRERNWLTVLLTSPEALTEEKPAGSFPSLLSAVSDLWVAGGPCRSAAVEARKPPVPETGVVLNRDLVGTWICLDIYLLCLFQPCTVSEWIPVGCLGQAGQSLTRTGSKE